MIALSFETRVRAAPVDVWKAASNMDGVNAELGPLLRMTHPAGGADLQSLGEGEPAFASWLLLFGCLPIDRHFLRLERILPGTGFDERSNSWTQKVWIHRRRITSDSGGSRVRDELEFEPRVALLRPLLRRVVRKVFEHRHRRLRMRFGEIVS